MFKRIVVNVFKFLFLYLETTFQWLTRVCSEIYTYKKYF